MERKEKCSDFLFSGPRSTFDCKMMYNKYKFFPLLSLSFYHPDVNFPTHEIIFAQRRKKYAVNKQMQQQKISNRSGNRFLVNISATINEQESSFTSRNVSFAGAKGKKLSPFSFHLLAAFKNILKNLHNIFHSIYLFIFLCI